MEATFGKGTCPKCNYKHATDNRAKDGSTEFFLCERCGYQHTFSNGEEMEMMGIGAYTFVGEKGIVCGGVFETKEIFFGNAAKLLEAVKGAKLFYSEKGENSGKYYLINYDTKQQYEFGEDDIICWDGLKKEYRSGDLKVTYRKK